LAGLAVGSVVLGAALGRVTRPGLAVAALVGATGACVLGLLFVLPEFESVLRGVRESAYRSAADVGADGLARAQRTCALVGSALLFAAPAVALGAVFPLSVRWAA